MASVFLSYDRDDAPKARPIAARLEKAGHSVWWDRHIRGGSEFSREIEQALNEADAVVVLWSERSVQSPWVRDEAAAGRDSGRLVPVALDATIPPLGFRQYQSVDLSEWKGRGNPAGIEEILVSIDALTGGEAGAPPKVTGAVVPVRRGLSRTAWLALGTAAVFATAGGAYFWANQSGRSSTPVVAVAAADNSVSTKSLTDDLFIKLGSLQSANSEALQLVEQDAGADPDLRFRVAQRTVDGQAQATLALLTGGKGDLLWSEEFRQEKRPEADLRQQVAYSAGLVLTCATEAMAGGHRELKNATLKVYLRGCAHLTDEDTGLLVQMFGKVTQEAPDFRGAWAKLLIAETYAFLESRRDPVIGKSLKAHIQQARQLNPTMAEAYVAEAWMQELRQINRWMPLSAAAVSKNPTNVFALTEHANDMFQVGRLQQGVAYARRAVQADPLSPWVRNALIVALINAGEIEAAKIALEDAERLWPGTSNLIHMRFFFTARYGDPREALAMLRSGKVSRQFVSPAFESFLEARIDPSPTKVDRAIAEARAASKQWTTHYIDTLGEFRRKEELIGFLLEFDPGAFLGPASVFQPRYSFLQNDVRFMEVMNRWRSQLDYWRKSGNWPDYCFRPDLPYDCKVEAARLARATG